MSDDQSRVAAADDDRGADRPRSPRSSPGSSTSSPTPRSYVNRELSWLDFNDRVLQLAEDESLPLIERCKFLAIFTTNLDEFFMVRVAGVHDQVDARIDARGPDGLSPTAGAASGSPRPCASWTAATPASSPSVVRPELAEHGIRIARAATSPRRRASVIERHFREQIFPVLTPLAIGPGRPFPYISNLSLSLIVRLHDPDLDHEVYRAREGAQGGAAAVRRDLPRTRSSRSRTSSPRHLDSLFPGMEIVSYDLFRVTRDADFEVSDEADDLLQAVEDELRRRRFGEVVRLEVGARMDPTLRTHLIEWLGVDETPGLRRRRPARPRRPVADRRDRRPRRPAPAAVDAAHPPRLRPRPGERRRAARRVRRDARRRRARPLPVPVVRDQRRAVRQAGRRRPRRARDQDDRVPDLGRLGAGPVADRGRREGQAGGVHGGAQGALRRAPEHPLVARPGRGRRPRRPRHPGPEDPRQGDPRRPPRARRRPPLRDDRDRQLPRQERPALRGLRPVHDRPRDRRRRSPTCSTR